MPRMSVKTAADVESICSKCGDVWHVVVAKVGDQIAKVQCKECGAYHRYRPPGAKKKSTATPRKRSSSTGGRKSAKSKSTAKAPEAAGPEIEPDMSRPVREYGASQSYEPADRVEHVKFGLGVVENVGDGKMQVYFPSGRRVLAQGRRTRKLSRPAPFRHESNHDAIGDAEGNELMGDGGHPAE